MRSLLIDRLPVRPPVRAALHEARHALEHLYGDRLVRLVLFGSQARGEARSDSDVDVLVVLRGPFDLYQEQTRLSDYAFDLGLKYDQEFMLLPFASDRYQDPHLPLLWNVHQEGVDLLP